MILSFLATVLMSATPLEMIVPLESDGVEGEYYSTSFLLDSTHLMTAAHALKHFTNENIAVCKNKKIKIRVKDIYLDSALDIAIVELPEKCEGIAIKLAAENPNYGASISSIGCPEEPSYCGMLTHGIVSLYKPTPLGLRMLSDMKIWYGNSGGPILNQKGELVGILIEIKSFSKIRSLNCGVVSDLVYQDYSVITPISEILSFLKRVEVDKAKH